MGCVTLGVIAFFIVLGNREALGNAADSVSNQIYASVASATTNALCYEQSDIDTKKGEAHKQNIEFGTIPAKIAAIDSQTNKLQSVIDEYDTRIAELRTQLVPEDRFTALQTQIDKVSKQIEDTATLKRLSSTQAALTKQVSILKNVSDAANANVTATKKLVDASVSQLAELKKIQPQIDAYQHAKSELAQVTSQLADQKVLDNKALEVAQAKLTFDKDQSAISQNAYKAKQSEYNALYSTYTKKYSADAMRNNGPITYTELASAKDRLTLAFKMAESAYKAVLAPYNAAYKTKAEISESDLTNAITYMQGEYDSAKANANDMNAKLVTLQKVLQENAASLASARALVGASVDVAAGGTATKIDTNIESLRGELVDLNKNLETLDLSDGSAQAGIIALQTKIEAMRASMETLATQKVDLKARYIELEGSIKKLNSDIEYYSLSVCKN